jgi:hypothetical protein
MTRSILLAAEGSAGGEAAVELEPWLFAKDCRWSGGGGKETIDGSEDDSPGPFPVPAGFLTPSG